MRATNNSGVEYVKDVDSDEIGPPPVPTNPTRVRTSVFSLSCCGKDIYGFFHLSSKPEKYPTLLTLFDMGIVDTICNCAGPVVEPAVEPIEVL